MTTWLRLVLVPSVIFSTSLVTRCEDEDPGVYTILTFNARQRLKKAATFEDFWSDLTNFSKSIFDGISNSVKHVFSEKEYDVINDRKEHGRLDSSARDLIREVSSTLDKTVNKIEDTLGFNKQNQTSGLDSDRSFFVGVAEKFKDTLRAIYPGTKWCGDGTKASNYDELGEFAETDKCCREHDNCSIYISAGETKFGLVNTGLFTRSHCSCDEKFYECLKKANTLVSKQIGTTYFTLLGPQCFKEDSRIIRCLKSEWGKCIHYETAYNGEKLYQWFDTPNF